METGTKQLQLYGRRVPSMNMNSNSAVNVGYYLLIKNTMQFACFFVKREVEDVGPVAMETSLPFDQKAILEQSAAYLKSHEFQGD